MARAKRICPKPGCPHVAVGRYCPQHNREYEAKRGDGRSYERINLAYRLIGKSHQLFHQLLAQLRRGRYVADTRRAT